MTLAAPRAPRHRRLRRGVRGRRRARVQAPRRRPRPRRSSRTDPKAVVESTGGTPIALQARHARTSASSTSKQLTYAGRHRPSCIGVKVVDRRPRRRPHVHGDRRRRATSARTSRSSTLDGDVRLVGERRPDGPHRARHLRRAATASSARRARSSSSRGRMSGTGIGMTYDKNARRR